MTEQYEFVPLRPTYDLGRYLRLETAIQRKSYATGLYGRDFKVVKFGQFFYVVDG